MKLNPLGWIKWLANRLGDRLRAFPWLVFSLLTCLIVALIAPWQLGVLSWSLTKLSIAAYLGYWLDRTMFPYARPHETCGGNEASAAMLRRAILVGCVVLAMSLAGCAAQAEPIPQAAEQHRALLIREARMQFGLNAPVARLAAQVHQESRWRTDAKSLVGAQGLAQFMPSTADWITQTYPLQLGGNAAPYTPAWSLRALAVYDRHLYDRVLGHTECDRWWFTLRSYNGGLGHIQAEARNAADPLDRMAVDTACGSARRSAKHCPENLGYPRKIMLRWEPMYLKAHWPGRLACRG